jgi:hypothetical protein
MANHRKRKQSSGDCRSNLPQHQPEELKVSRDCALELKITYKVSRVLPVLSSRPRISMRRSPRKAKLYKVGRPTEVST